MKNKFYKIGDFSKLTGVSIKSLRYYDKINILSPAFIDENTNYRYYLPEQAIMVNIIKLCLILDLPLKLLTSTQENNPSDQKNVPNLKKIIALGQKKAENQLKETKKMINLLQDISQQTERLDKSHKEKELYFSQFPKRKILITPWNMATDNEKNYIEKIADLTEKAQKNNLNILTQQGLFSDLKKNKTYVFITVEGDCNKKDLLKFPKSTYGCINLQERELKNLQNIINEKGYNYRYAFFINTDIYDFCLDHPLHKMEVQCTNDIK